MDSASPSIWQVIGQLLLGLAIIYITYRIVLAGNRIAGAKNDEKERKEALRSVINSALLLIVFNSIVVFITLFQDFLRSFYTQIDLITMISAVVSILLWITVLIIARFIKYQQQRRSEEHLIEQIRRKDTKMFQNVANNLKNVMERNDVE